jgi:hypothetical protein
LTATAALAVWRSVLQPRDHELWRTSVGGSLARLLDRVEGMPRHELERFAGNVRIFAHALNAHGLHPLRSLLAERLNDRLRDAQPWDRERLGGTHARFMREGLVRLPLPSMPGSADDASEVMGLLRMVSGLGNDGVLAARPKLANRSRITFGDLFLPTGERRRFEFQAVRGRSEDEQHYMHVDTYQPTWKAWIFKAGTDASHGTLHYVPGSHRLTAGKLRWLFNRSRTVTERVPLLTPKDHPKYGPFRDPSPGGGSGAIRFVGFDPRQPHEAIEPALAEFGFGAVRPIGAPCVARRGGCRHPATLVIADTSGLHLRGYAPGSTRQQLSLDLSGKRNKDDNVVPRHSLFALAGKVDVATRRRS